MSELHTLDVAVRDRAGKGSARAARREGKIPAVIYGDKKPSEMVTLGRNQLARLMNRGEFVGKLFQVTVPGGEEQRVLVRDLQKDPVTDEPVHVDLFRLGEGAIIVFEVPVHFINEEVSPGMKRGGVLNIVRHDIEVRCRARDLPDFIEIDLADMDIGDSAHGSSVTLPADVEMAISDRDFTIATIAAPKVSADDTDEDEGEASEEGAEAAEGEETEAAEGGEE